MYVPPHPLVSHWVAVARNAASPAPMFRAALAELGRLLIYEATRDWLPTLEGSVATPCGTADVTFIDPGQPVKVGPGSPPRSCPPPADPLQAFIPGCGSHHSWPSRGGI